MLNLIKKIVKIKKYFTRPSLIAPRINIFFYNRFKKKILSNISSVEINNKILLGTAHYGGKVFQDNPNLHNSTIISCGLGNDASFDIDFINKYNAKIIVVDPTPAAKKHYNEIVDNFGSSSTKNFNTTGNKQPVEAYDLKNVNKDNLKYIERALFITDDEDVKFFKPLNTTHVSYSLSNFLFKYDQDAEYVKVKTITIKKIMQLNNIKKLPLLKLDIEGAEIEVLEQLMKNNIYPNQILIDFDELRLQTNLVANRFFKIYNILIDNKYKLIETHTYPDLSFIRQDK